MHTHHRMPIAADVYLKSPFVHLGHIIISLLPLQMSSNSYYGTIFAYEWLHDDKCKIVELNANELKQYVPFPLRESTSTLLQSFNNTVLL